MRFEPVIKLDVVVAAVIGAATILISVWQYLETSEREAARYLATAEREAKKPFFELQMNLCADATNAAATLATSTSAYEWERAKGRFMELYWGKLVIVEDRGVEVEMLDFERNLRDLEGPADPEISSFGTLKLLSKQLALACRNLMRSSWEVELESLNGQ